MDLLEDSVVHFLNFGSFLLSILEKYQEKSLFASFFLGLALNTNLTERSFLPGQFALQKSIWNSVFIR